MKRNPWNSKERKVSPSGVMVTGVRQGSVATGKRGSLVDAKEACLILGVKPQTLYAYVSRGLVRGALKAGAKTNLYHREDVETLALRGRKGKVSDVPAERYLRLGGSAVLPTSISSIDSAGPRYRGHSAVDLARAGRSFEEVVELLWSGVLPATAPVWAPVSVPPAFGHFMSVIEQVAKLNSTRRLLALIAEAYTACAGRHAELTQGAPVLAARNLILIFTPTLGLLMPTPRYALPSLEPRPIATMLSDHGRRGLSSEFLMAINACLILCAEHELAPSTFAARIAASAGGDIFSCVNSALGAFEGPLTGIGCDESEAILRTTTPKAYVDSLKAYRIRKAWLPGYDHPLYPEGDPRATLLLEIARSLSSGNAAARNVLNCAKAAEDELGAKPSLAVGLVATCIALRFPANSPGVIMAIGRCAGWVAHAFEQRLAGYLMRPRARYVGPPSPG